MSVFSMIESLSPESLEAMVDGIRDVSAKLHHKLCDMRNLEEIARSAFVESTNSDHTPKEGWSLQEVQTRKTKLDEANDKSQAIWQQTQTISAKLGFLRSIQKYQRYKGLENETK